MNLIISINMMIAKNDVVRILEPDSVISHDSIFFAIND
jgi:hypothetical protein